jgi:hypothetical protein
MAPAAGDGDAFPGNGILAHPVMIVALPDFR